MKHVTYTDVDPGPQGPGGAFRNKHNSFLMVGRNFQEGQSYSPENGLAYVEVGDLEAEAERTKHHDDIDS